jgi:hypothetical protein
LPIEGRSELTAEAQRIISELQQSHEAELALRQAAAQAAAAAFAQYAQRQAAAQAAAAAFAQYAQTQQIISSMNRPVNCIHNGHQTGLSDYNMPIGRESTKRAKFYAPPLSDARRSSMNIRRGLLRLWIVSSMHGLSGLAIMVTRPTRRKVIIRA